MLVRFARRRRGCPLLAGNVEVRRLDTLYWSERGVILLNIGFTTEELKHAITADGTAFPKITETQVLEAYTSALIRIRDKYDALYFFACMNLLNAYVKNEDAAAEFADNYRFKQYVVSGLEQVIKRHIEGVFVYIERKIAYVSVLGLQFSFHNLTLSSALQDHMRSRQNVRQEWTGIRLQTPAALIFEWARQVRSTKGKAVGVKRTL